ncbi:hypothetical protein JB92DRAFT_3096430 [Gautieria morchelliformis]|nr:hypothetical protein JB92DRAFT_3096430 [Gautieria morchelliformis]
MPAEFSFWNLVRPPAFVAWTTTPAAFPFWAKGVLASSPVFVIGLQKASGKWGKRVNHEGALRGALCISFWGVCQEARTRPLETGLIVKLSWQVDQTTQTSPMDQYTASPLFHACLTWASANAIGGRSPSGRVVLLGNPDTKEAVECEHDVGNAENGVGKCVGAAPRRSREGTPGEQGLWATFEEFTREDIEKIDVWITPKKSMRRPSATGDPGSPGLNRGAMPPCNQAPEIKLPVSRTPLGLTPTAARSCREGTPGEERLWGTFEEFTAEDIEKIDAWITPKKSTRRVSATHDTGSPGPHRGAMPPCNQAPEIKLPISGALPTSPGRLSPSEGGPQDFLVKDNACPSFHAELDDFFLEINAAPFVLSQIDRVVPTFRRNMCNTWDGVFQFCGLERHKERLLQLMEEEQFQCNAKCRGGTTTYIRRKSNVRQRSEDRSTILQHNQKSPTKVGKVKNTPKSQKGARGRTGHTDARNPTPSKRQGECQTDDTETAGKIGRRVMSAKQGNSWNAWQSVAKNGKELQQQRKPPRMGQTSDATNPQVPDTCSLLFQPVDLENDPKYYFILLAVCEKNRILFFTCVTVSEQGVPLPQLAHAMSTSHPDDLENGSDFDGVLSSPEPNELIDVRREWESLCTLVSLEDGGPLMGYPPVHGVQSNVPVTQQTRVQTLYTYPVNMHVEYPSTSADGSIGHLFKMDPDHWLNPCPPRGRSVLNKPAFTKLLKDESGNLVPCIRAHNTCQGLKICPKAPLETLKVAHTSASHELLKERLGLNQAIQAMGASESRTIHEATMSYLHALFQRGCGAPTLEPTHLSTHEHTELKSHHDLLTRARRGLPLKEGMCEGSLLFDVDSKGDAFVSCEHYNTTSNRMHFLDYAPSKGTMDLDYIDAILDNDIHEIAWIERAATDRGYGAQVQSSTVANFSSQRIVCPCDHWQEDGKLQMMEMDHLPCKSKFTIWTPHEEYRRSLLPDISNPTLADLHVSLANRDRLRRYITVVKQECYPRGTGWEGAINCHEQELAAGNTEQYIRFIGVTPAHDIEGGTQKDEESGDNTGLYRFVVCMTPTQSYGLLRAQYVQSDTAFRRVVGYDEFEIGAWDVTAKSIEEIVRLDTGFSLTWRHLHSTSLHEHQGIRMFTVDEHGGQAKAKNLGDLTISDHLHRILRLCQVHVHRNIKTTKVPESVKNLMRSLISSSLAEDWVKQKYDTNFAFAALCWELSHIPLDVWKAGARNSNLIETLHADEGMHFDLMKLKSVEVIHNTGIRPSYQSEHARFKAFASADARIQASNDWATRAAETLQRALVRLQDASRLPKSPMHQARFEARKTTFERAQAAHAKACAASRALQEMGSGQIHPI